MATGNADTFDAIVIGAGEAGAIVATQAVAAGMQVAMVYREPYGSTCLNVGCVPTKFMIHRARIAHLTRTAGRFHVDAGEPTVDLEAIVREKDEFLSHPRERSYRTALATENLTLLEGEARFAGPKEVEVHDRRLSSDQIFIATGLRPLIPPIEGLDHVEFLTSDNIMDLTSLPEHLIVVGGGYIACELGQAYHRYGSKVTMLEMLEHLVPLEEPDVSTLLERALRAEGMDVLLGHRVTRVESVHGQIRVVAQALEGQELVVEGSHLLMAAGRRPNTDRLNLGAAGIETDKSEFIVVNEYLETNVPGIWAVGDVNGHQPFTRVCQEEGKVAYTNAFEGARVRMERHHLGHAIFTDPEIGSVGLTEREARENGLDVAAGLVTFDKIEKAKLLGETVGLIKYIVDRKTRRILGCHVIGPNGADLIYDAIVVMRHSGTLDELAKAVGVHPTLQEGMEGTARALLHGIAPEEVRGPLVTAPLSFHAGYSESTERR